MRKRFRSVLVTATFVIGGMVGTQGPALADFVCPVFEDGSAAQLHNKNIDTQIYGGDWTLFPGTEASAGTDRPDQATNDDGDGTPAGEHLSPGDLGYSPIWNTN